MKKEKTEFKGIFICILSGEYNSYHRKSYYLYLAKFFNEYLFIFVNRPIDFVLCPIKKQKKLSQKKIIKITNNIILLTPILLVYDVITLNINNTLKQINYSFFKKQINDVLSNNKLKKIVFVTQPDLIDYVDYIHYDYVIYDMYDEFVVSNSYKNINKREKKLIDISSQVFIVSNYLNELKIKEYPNIKSSISKNAIDKQLFYSNEKLPNKIEKNIIYVGNIKKYIDIDLINFIAKNRPDYNLFLTGNADKYYKEQFLYSNIHFIGAKKYEDLPAEIRKNHIGIIPYKVDDSDNGYIKSISPMKLYEYLASDLYVVSTLIPDVIDFQKTPLGQKKVAVANNKEEFLEKIDYFLTLPKEKISEAELYSISWEQRFEKIKEKMIELNII